MNTVSLTLTELCLLGAILIICAVLITPALGQTGIVAAAPVSTSLRGVARMLKRKSELKGTYETTTKTTRSLHPPRRTDQAAQ